MAKAARLGHVTAQVEFAIMLFNGVGVPKDEAAAAVLFRRAALSGNAIAQNRYARLLSAGRGTGQDKVEAAGWHLVAKKKGLGDPMLDDMVAKLSDADRQKAEALARKWGG
jgi:TPR repeat protein